MDSLEKEINRLGDKWCDDFEKIVDEKMPNDDIYICDICPFTDYCSKGERGASAFLEEKLLEALKEVINGK